MFSPARHHFGELQLAAPEREVLVWSGSPREGRDRWSVLAWSPPPVESRENGVRGQRDLPSARGAAELRPPSTAVQDATTDDTAPAASGASQAADPDRRSPRNPQLSGPVLGQRTRREAGWRWGVMVDLGPLGPPWTSSKLMFAQQMPIPQVRPGRAHLGRYPGRRGSTPLPRSAAVRDLAGRKTRSRRNGAYSSFRCSSKMKMSAFGDAASLERRSGGPGADQDEQQGAGPSRRRPESP